MTIPTAVVSEQEWNSQREALLVKEKELTRARDALAAERRRLPMVRVEKEYRFEGPEGEFSLLDLFEGRRQLIVYRFFLDPGMKIANYPEQGCPGCTLFADNLPNLTHLNARDTTLVFVSAGSQEAIRNYRARMGWADWPWYTTLDDFSADFDVSQWFGINVFLRDTHAAQAGTRSTAATTRRPGPPRSSAASGRCWTSRRSAAKRSGRTRPRASRRTAPAHGRAGTTSTRRRSWPAAGRADISGREGFPTRQAAAAAPSSIALATTSNASDQARSYSGCHASPASSAIEAISVTATKG